jgi:hypothetical protein
MVRNLVSLIDAYNARQLGAVSLLLVDDVIWADCDFRSGTPVAANGRAEVEAFLSRRFADHEQLEIARVEGLNPDNPGGLALGVDYSLRTSDTLRALGFPNGIKGPSGVKIVFAPDGRIRAVAHASLPGRTGDCQPR